MTGTSWREIADGVHVLRYPVLDVNVTVVRGDGYAVVVDSLSTAAQAGELRDALTALGVDRFCLVNTHHHFDHCFGNDTLAGPGCPIWAHEETVRLLRERPGALVAAACAEYGPTDGSLAVGLPTVRVRAPDHPVRERAVLDIGGRVVQLWHPGRGHTGGDLVVLVPDVDVLVAGDLVEQGAAPDFGDAYPLGWPDTLADLLAVATGPVVPGHGDVVDADFVRAQHAELTELSRRVRDGHAAGAPVEQAAAAGPYDEATRRTAVRRGYAELSGRDALP